MKAIFEKEFLELSKRLDNTLDLTNYIIGSKYSSSGEGTNNFIEKLFSGEYILSDTRQISAYPLYSIWEKEEKVLKAYIELPEVEKEKLVDESVEYDFIYIYALYPDGSEKIAIVLCEPSMEEDKFLPLELNISGNLIEISFPNDTLGTIRCQMDNDTEFLENIGIKSGVNIFIEDNDIVARKSYYKYLRNYKTGGQSSAFLYNSVNGEKIYGDSYRKIYKDVTLSSLSSVDSIPKEGGYISLLGKATYDVYRYINNYNPTVYKKDIICDIMSIPFLDFIIVDNPENKMSIEFIRERKKLKISQNSTGEEISATVKLRITNPDGNVIESPPLVLTQK